MDKGIMSHTALPDGRRVVVTEFGDDPMQALENHLEIVPQPAPDPATLAATDVIIAIKSVAVGWVDLLMTSGQYQHMPAPPYCPGLEYAGEVVWTGADVTRVAVGDAVIADGFLTGPRSYGDHQGWGGFATYAVAPEAAAMPMPGSLSYDQGANLLGNFETAYHCLVARGELQAGETVLIHGASGSTGLAAVKLAKVLGATVIATGRSPEKLAVVAEQGADHVISTATSGDEPLRFRDQVKALTGGRGADVVYDGVGGAISLETLRCLRFGARYLIVGWAATPFVARGRGKRGAPNANVLPTNLIMMKGLDVLGCPTIISTKFNPALRPERLRRIVEWVEEGRLTPHVGPAYALEDVKEAMRAKWSSRFPGGCVLHP